MKTQLAALNAERELIEEEYNVVYDKMIVNLDKIINKYFVEPFEAKCTRRYLREEFYPRRGVDICFEVGFHNVEEDRIDFGSDMWFEYDCNKGHLKVNHGTCGYYSKEDIYQVKRIKALAHVWNNITEIEAHLDNYVAEVTPIVLKYTDKIADVEHEIHAIENAIKEQEKAKIEESITIGTVMHYDSECTIYNRDKLFFDTCTVAKVTPKFVTMIAPDKHEYKVRKDDLIKHILLKYVIMEDNDEL